MLPDAEVEVAEQPNAARSAAPPPVSVPGTYVVQAGAFPNFADADKVKARLALLGVVSEIQRLMPMARCSTGCASAPSTTWTNSTGCAPGCARTASSIRSSPLANRLRLATSADGTGAGRASRRRHRRAGTADQARRPRRARCTAATRSANWNTCSGTPCSGAAMPSSPSGPPAPITPWQPRSTQNRRASSATPCSQTRSRRPGWPIRSAGTACSARTLLAAHGYAETQAEAACACGLASFRSGPPLRGGLGRLLATRLVWASLTPAPSWRHSSPLRAARAGSRLPALRHDGQRRGPAARSAQSRACAATVVSVKVVPQNVVDAAAVLRLAAAIEDTVTRRPAARPRPTLAAHLEFRPEFAGEGYAVPTPESLEAVGTGARTGRLQAGHHLLGQGPGLSRCRRAQRPACGLHPGLLANLELPAVPGGAGQVDVTRLPAAFQKFFL